MYYAWCFVYIGLCCCSSVFTERKEGFKIIWNIPVQACNRYLNTNIAEDIRKYGFIHNTNNAFVGDEITTLYNPGLFPALLNDTNSSDVNDFLVRNGGMPQLGNLTLHLNIFEEQLNRVVPDVNSTAIISIDMEDWRPIYDMNFGTLDKYRIISRNLISQKYPNITNATIINLEAAKEFNAAAKEFMLQTLELGLKMRPKSRMGYYILPFCFNSEYNPTLCPPNAMKLNDELGYLFEKQTATLPDLYLSDKNITEEIRAQLLKSRATEGIRVSQTTKNTVPTYPYVNYRYQDTNQVYSDKDMHSSFGVPKSVGVQGVVLWGSSNEIRNKEQCEYFSNLLNTRLGPIAKIYIGSKGSVVCSCYSLIIFSLFIFIFMYLKPGQFV